MIVVFISGASASGKTGLAKKLETRLNQSALKGKTCRKISMDDYYKPRPENMDPQVFRETTNFDTPHMLQLDLLKEHLVQLAKGEIITKSKFDFLTNRPYAEEVVEPADIIVIEGLFAGNLSKRLPLSFQKLVVHVQTSSYRGILKRRIERDINDPNRNIDPETTKACEKRTVGPGFLSMLQKMLLEQIYI